MRTRKIIYKVYIIFLVERLGTSLRRLKRREILMSRRATKIEDTKL